MIKYNEVERDKSDVDKLSKSWKIVKSWKTLKA